MLPRSYGGGRRGNGPRYYPEYAPDLYGAFFEDPDGSRSEVIDFRAQRRKLMYERAARGNTDR